MSGVVMLATDSPQTWMVFDALDAAIGVEHVILEEPVDARTMLMGRARRLGWTAAAGQAAFRAGVMPFLEWRSRGRRAEIIAQSGLTPRRADESRTSRVGSVNDDASVALLRRRDPAVVVVAGTRIIARRVLEAVPATFLNMHAGITPRFRGVHGAYWALASGDREHCGVTVHVVDPGVDTGPIVAQARIDPTERDTFVTYPLLQLAAGLPLLVDAVRAALDGALEPVPPSGPSAQWYHPTARSYWWTRIRRGVR